MCTNGHPFYFDRVLASTGTVNNILPIYLASTNSSRLIRRYLPCPPIGHQLPFGCRRMQKSHSIFRETFPDEKVPKVYSFNGMNNRRIESAKLLSPLRRMKSISSSHSCGKPKNGIPNKCSETKFLKNRTGDAYPENDNAISHHCIRRCVIEI